MVRKGRATTLIHYDCEAGLLEVSEYDCEGKLAKRVRERQVAVLMRGEVKIRLMTYAFRKGILAVIGGGSGGACEGSGGE